MTSGALVSDPSANLVPPVFNDERLSKLLSLSVTESSLRFTCYDQVRLVVDVTR